MMFTRCNTKSFTLGEHRLAFVLPGPSSNPGNADIIPPAPQTAPETTDLKDKQQVKDAVDTRAAKAEEDIRDNLANTFGESLGEQSADGIDDILSRLDTSQASTPEQPAPAKNELSKPGFVPARESVAAKTPVNNAEATTSPSTETAPTTPPETAAPTTEVLPEDALQKQKKITALQAQLNDIDTKLKDKDISGDQRKALELQKEQLTAELNSLTEGVETQLKEPETKGELLEQQLEQAFAKLENAKGPAQSFAAIMEILVTLIQYIQGYGTLNDSLKKAEDAENIVGETTEGVENKNETEKQRNERLNKELKERSEKNKIGETNNSAPIATENLDQNIDGLKQGKEAEIKEIDTDIKILDAGIKNMKAKNALLLAEKGEIEQMLNEMKGNDKIESKVISLNAQLEAIQTSIDANNKALETIDKRHDELVAKKELLTKDIKKLEEMKTDLTDAEELARTSIDRATGIIKRNLPNIKIPEFGIKIDGNGNTVIIINGEVPDDLQKLLPKDAKKNDSGVIEVPAEDLPKITGARTLL